MAALVACAKGQEPLAPWLTEPTPAAHDAFFPIASGPHATDCNSCHGQSDSFQGFTCLTCHTQPQTDPSHGGVSGYQYASASCYTCHPRGTGTLAPALHANFFPIAQGQSHAVGTALAGPPGVIDCTTCHVDPTTQHNVDCTACHLQSGGGTPGPAVPADQPTAHAGKVSTTPANLWLGTGPVGSGSGASASCVKCHGGDARPAGFVAVHGQASTATGGVVFAIDSTSKSHFASCDQCHTATRTDPNRKNPEFDFAQASCDACHAPSGTSSVLTAHTAFGAAVTAPYVAGDPNNASACLGCHPGGGSATGFSHTWFPISAADVHNSSVAACSTCHANTASYQGSPAANVSLVACTSCHDDSAANAKNQASGLGITLAHSRGRVGKDIWDIPGGLDYTQNALCLKCHAGNIGGSVAGFSTPLVFRLAQHDAHCSLQGKNLLNGDTTHNVNRNADNGVNICFACHDGLASATATPWATQWALSGVTSCTACHQHQTDSAPHVTCQ
jgi:hypothetical protein